MVGKAALRGLMRRRLESLAATPETWAEASRRACAALEASPEWAASSTVLGYLALRAELSCDSLLAAALAEGRTVAVPRTAGDELTFYSLRSLDGPWGRGPFGLREPLPDATRIEPEASRGPLLVIVPGLAFDARGGRLGRGKGYYDRFLRRLRILRSDAVYVGFAAHAQIVDAVPTDGRDERVDALCTDAGFQYVLQ